MRTLYIFKDNKVTTAVVGNDGVRPHLINNKGAHIYDPNTNQPWGYICDKESLTWEWIDLKPSEIPKEFKTELLLLGVLQ